MFEIIGIMGCVWIASVVCAAASLIVTVVDVAYSADAANDDRAIAADNNKKNEERANQSALVQQRQTQLSMLRAAQNAVTSVLYDSLQTEKETISTKRLRNKLNRVGSTPTVRPERNYGTTLK